MTATRTMVVWCPDWPVAAAVRAGVAAEGEPFAVLRLNRVVAASAAARRAGVRRTMRRRDAQSRCPDLAIADDDPGRDARLFEPVAALIDVFTPRIEVVRPGLCQFPTRGPSRYFGGDDALARALALRLASDGVDVCIGIADSAFAAALAARGPSDSHAGGPEHGGRMTVLPPGATAGFLAAHPVSALVAVEGGRAVTRAARTTRRSSSSDATDADALALIDLVDLLQRLGLRTLGSLAALAEGDVAARFGPVGIRAWSLANGHDVRPPLTRIPPPDLVVEAELDPPAEQIDTAAFVARGLAEELHDRLAAHGLACTRISIEAETEHGEHLARLWRHERAGATGGLTPTALADRVRWQIDGWLQRDALRATHPACRPDVPRHERTTGGITLLRLVPDEVVPETGRQLGLWGGVGAADVRADRAFARVQGLLGPDAVTRAVPVGGRRPADLVRHVAWGDGGGVVQGRQGDDGGVVQGRQGDGGGVVQGRQGDDGGVGPCKPRAWPGSLPSPLPAIVHPLPLAADVLDVTGASIGVSGRGEASGVPVRLVVRGSPSQETNRPRADRPRDGDEIVGWGGPWLLDERWWDPVAHRRQARMQLLTVSGGAYLVVLEGGSWWVEASYA